MSAAEHVHSEEHRATDATRAQEELREMVNDADARIRNAVAEQPLLAMGLALAAGYLLGRLISRS